MARPLRIEYPDALYFVSVKARDDAVLFAGADNKKQWLLLLNKICNQFHWRCYGFAILQNSYLLMIQTPNANLGKGMRELNGIFTQFYSRQNNRVGPVLQKRYKAILVDGEDKAVLRQLTIMFFNRVQKNEEALDPGDWIWSHAPRLLGRSWAPKWLCWREILSWYATETGEARRKFIKSISTRFDSTGFNSDLIQIKKQQFIGSDVFIKKALKQQANYNNGKNSKIEAHHLSQQPIDRAWNDLKKQDLNRNEAISLLYATGQYGLKDIGKIVGLHYSTISRIVNKGIKRI